MRGVYIYVCTEYRWTVIWFNRIARLDCMSYHIVRMLVWVWFCGSAERLVSDYRVVIHIMFSDERVVV